LRCLQGPMICVTKAALDSQHQLVIADRPGATPTAAIRNEEMGHRASLDLRAQLLTSGADLVRPAGQRYNAADEVNGAAVYGFVFDFCGLEIERDTGTQVCEPARRRANSEPGPVRRPRARWIRHGGRYGLARTARLWRGRRLRHRQPFGLCPADSLDDP